MTMARKDYVVPTICVVEMEVMSIMAGSTKMNDAGSEGRYSGVEHGGASIADAPERIYFDYNYDEE